MSIEREIHPDFRYHLRYKEEGLINMYTDLRAFILSIYPESNELLYHTHALTSLYTVTEKMGDGFCLVPIYNQHLNLAFSKGRLLKDSNNLLQGTGKLMRHIPIKKTTDYRNTAVKELIKEAITLALEDARPNQVSAAGRTISKIKK